MKQAQVSLTKAVLWEEAKGKLRALVAAQGHRRLCDDSQCFKSLAEDNAAHEEWQAFQARVEAFISGIEDDGLQE